MEKHGDNYTKDYLTDVIRRKAVHFLDNMSRSADPKPFLMVLAPPACHAPFTPAPQYRGRFQDQAAPRTPAYNRDQASDPPKHWLLQTEPRQMSNETAALVDEVFRNRWRTLLSVDDLVAKVHKALSGYGMLENTYFLITSDHGYHLGQVTPPPPTPPSSGCPWTSACRMSLTSECRCGCPDPTSRATRASTPPSSPSTLLPPSLPWQDSHRMLQWTVSGGGLQFLIYSSGLSLLPLVLPNTTAPTLAPPTDIQSNEIPGIGPDYTGITGRNSFLVEYQGEGAAATSSPSCSGQLGGDLANLAECDARLSCKCQDARNNTYACIRSYGQEDSLFCKFEDGAGFLEMYSLTQDHFQLANIAGLLQNETRQHYLGELELLRNCKGRECNNL